MATAPTHGRTILAMLCCMCFLFLIVTVATLNEAALVKADDPSLSPSLELYFLLPAYRVITVASPSGSSNGSDFGSITIFNTITWERPAESSIILGQAIGQRICALDGSLYVDFTYILSVSGYTGSVSGQGVQDSLGNGDLAIMGGTGDFLSASGHVTTVVVTPDVLVKSLVYIKYGCQ